jgi:hypothetical protein
VEALESQEIYVYFSFDSLYVLGKSFPVFSSILRLQNKNENIYFLYF